MSKVRKQTFVNNRLRVGLLPSMTGLRVRVTFRLLVCCAILIFVKLLLPLIVCGKNYVSPGANL